MQLFITAFVICNILNFPLYRFLFRKFFANTEEFKEALLFLFTPEIFSLFRGEFWEDMQAEMKLGIFFAICAAVVLGELFLFHKILDWFGA